MELATTFVVLLGSTAVLADLGTIVFAVVMK